MSGAELTCQELVELVTAYLEGALAPSERLRFEQHLAGCAGCTAYLAQMRQTIALLGTLSAHDIDPGAEQALLVHFRNWKRR